MPTYDYDPRTGGDSYTLMASVPQKPAVDAPCPDGKAARHNLRDIHAMHASTPRPENSL